MNNNFNGGMPGAGGPAVMPTGAPGPKPQSTNDILGKKLKVGSISIPIVAVAAAAAAILVVFICLLVAVVGVVSTNGVKGAVMVLKEDPEETNWEKYYPVDIADAIDKYNNYPPCDETATIRILSVTKVGGPSKELLEDAVLQFSDNKGAGMKKSEVKVSAGYIVTAIVAPKKSSDSLCTFLVIKSNGRYGVYQTRNMVTNY